MGLLGRYKNGNFVTTILSDGTKIRETKDDEFIPSFAENMDIKICNYCDMGCKFCHEGSTINGKFGNILNEKFIDTLHPYQEVAIGGGDATSHPNLIPFLKKLKERKVIANMTVNQIHFEKKHELIKKLVDEKLIYGLGVSLVNPTKHFIELIKQYPNAVIHVINGVLKPSDIKALENNNLKMLILGYKHLRRGNEYFEEEQNDIETKQQWLYENLEDIIQKFQVVSFDNLAIEQLDVKRLLTQEEWDEFYMGDDGKVTYYVDMVERKFAQSSTAPFDKRYDLLDSVDDMFKVITR
ncbi:radical SAM protein [Blautia wexlerae]|uniref:radical SAM protein n=1 Tax=Blautia wexlerae TaxID=418240 RepID=UPI001570659C|nr:radical SAM protein [Blautia wexlerae]NSD49062.1 radical SAM protein [Blautia wexlerae]NSD50568.1 radical SAM protein [Blautia wexlerae]NSK03157.1 radical SAM protein [Blautia wexlerae]NSK41023.1 radical SAM protein [Blautia wexlerae]